MGGEGSMTYAIISLKRNRAMLKKRKFREVKDLLYEISGKTEIEFRNISPDELSIIKARIRNEAKLERKRMIFGYIAASIFSIIFIYFIYWWIDV